MGATAQGEIEIIRDAYGIPHCFAPSEPDAFFAQGYVHAADRLWQMDYDRRRAHGRWAEVAGERGVPSDVFYRRLDLVPAVERDLAALSEATRAMLDAYAAGVNARIAEGRFGREFAIAGTEPQPWQPVDSLLVHRVRHVLMGSVRHKLWRSVVANVLGSDFAREMVASRASDDILCVPPAAPSSGAASGLADAEGGSNNWVLAGSRTGSGLPLLAGDPHRELEAPNVYVQAHVACPEWDALGIGMPGVPGFPHFGHNAAVAWSITHAMADDQDLFEVDTRTFPCRTETIEVRDGAPVDVDVVHTPRGPVIGDGLALCWTATIETNLGFDALVPMLHATTVEELFESMRPWVEPANSLLAADITGTIGYLTRGRLPRRRRADAAWFPIPYNDDRGGWDGWVPFEEMPRLINPPGGFLFSANNTIAASPYIGVDTAPSWRARRIVERLTTSLDANVGDMASLHRDVVSLPGRRVAERIAWDRLDGWDGSMATSSRAAAAYAVFRFELMNIAFERSGLDAVITHPRNRVLPGVLSENALWRVVEQHLHSGDAALLGGWTWDDAIAEAITRAERSEHNGKAWGDLHRASPIHALRDPSLDPSAIATEGDPDTVMVGGYDPTEGFRARTGSVARYAFDVGDWDRSGWVVPLGAAGDVAAPHGADQQHAWRTGELLPAVYTRDAVTANATDTVRLPCP